MSNSKRRRKRRGGRRTASRKRGGVLLGMRSGFKGVAGQVRMTMTGESPTGKHEERARWLGRIITVLLLAAAIGLLAQRL